MDALQTLPSLARLRISLPNLRVPMGLDAFEHLREIATEESAGGEGAEDVHDGLASAVARNPHITSICVSDSWRYGRTVPRTRSLHQLFKHYPAEAPPLKLRHLGLSMCLVRLDGDVMHHLQHLTSLRLTAIEDPYFIRPSQPQGTVADTEEEDAAIMQERLRYGSSLEDVWKALRMTDVRLETIEVDAVPFALMQYLQSYSGLKQLVLTPGGFDEGAVAMSDIVAAQFFDDNGPLGSHAQSLEDLQISAMHEGGWCFGVHNAKALAKCTKLRNLRMNVISSQLTHGPGFVRDTVQAVEEDVIVSRLEFFLHNMLT